MTHDIITRYLRFATIEAHGRSPIYEELARHVAGSSAALAFLTTLPTARQQPNLFFAAMRHVTGQVVSADQCDDVLNAHGSKTADVMMTRSTQTNEPGRCACLMPALAQIEGPIALIEVGASAGLCLLPDLYGYDWGQKGLPGSPAFPCSASENTPLPVKHPDIVWRAGLDLNPLDVGDCEDMAWLQTLVWPEDTDRLMRLRAAIKTAKSAKPRVVRGDLTCDLAPLMNEAPKDATLVVFHTAVLSYISNQSVRDAFADQMLASDAIWLANEGPRIFPQFATAADRSNETRFRLTRNGETIAWTGPHGQSVDWV